jgi:transposase
MPKTHPAYPPEYRARIVELARAGRSPEELAREFEPCSHTIRSWLRGGEEGGGGGRQGRGGGRVPAPIGAALDADERDELRRLRRENKQLRIERDILSKGRHWSAIGPSDNGDAWFAQNDVTSSRSSNS